MRIHLVSDIHSEMQKDQGEAFARDLEPNGSDVLVLAGDIISLKNTYWPLKLMGIYTSKYRDVIYVDGNHEYYNTNPTKAQETLRLLENTYSNLHVLRDGLPKVVQGKRFIGGTLWFKDDQQNAMYASNMNDFYVIAGFVPWVYHTNENTIRNLEQNLQEGDILVTHHFPTAKSIHPKYVGDGLNRFFCCDIEQLIVDRKPALCLHGHTHECFDYMIGPTRVVANPRGYTNERKFGPAQFDLKKYIDL